MKLIADTGLLVAFLNRRDAHHGWAAALMAEADFPVLTCEPVLTEAAWHLRDSERLLELVTEDVLRPALDCRDEADALLGLTKRYADRSPDFCDICVVRLSELFSRHTVATVDKRDFSIYRRFGQQVIPIVCPE
jgi:predicted nucleic acid-binding protein